MSKLIAGCGSPDSGKTTVALKLAQDFIGGDPCTVRALPHELLQMLLNLKFFQVLTCDTSNQVCVAIYN